MTDDVMERLADVESMPRGKRLATWFERHPANRGEDVPERMWRRLLIDSVSLLYVFATGSREQVLRYAAPLRKCREQRQRQRAENAHLLIALKKHGNNVTRLPSSSGNYTAYSVVITKSHMVREMLVVERETSDRLRKALSKYGRHDVMCPARPSLGPLGCTCGLDEARR